MREEEFSENVEQEKRRLEEERRKFEEEKAEFEKSNHEDLDSGIGSRNDSAEVYEPDDETGKICDVAFNK